MKKNTIIPILLIVAILLSGCFALQEPQESSGAVAAPTLAPQEQPPLSVQEGEEAAAVPTPQALQDIATEEPPAEAAEAPEAAEAYPAQESPPTAAPEAAEAYPAQETAVEPEQPDLAADEAGSEAVTEAGGETAVYEIDSTRSEARFTINEVLQGAPKTVVGVSRNLGGQIALDLNNPGTAQIGAILINARDFATDNEFRNNAIANKILLTNDHEFITFEPTAISGLPQTAVIGQTYEIQISGNLTIIGQTREVTFDAQVTPLSENELAGLAALDILYADYGVTIPLARSVESVEDTVRLELEFIAAAQ